MYDTILGSKELCKSVIQVTPRFNQQNHPLSKYKLYNIT